MENFISKPLKKKQFGKNNSLTSVESLKTPKIRRKSLGTVLPTPKVSKKLLDLTRRQSLDAVQNAKKSKNPRKESASANIVAQRNENEEVGKYVRPPTEHSLTKVVKRPLHVKGENKIQPNKTPLVLAPTPTKSKQNSNVKSPKVKKTPQNEPNQNIQDEKNLENKESIAVLEEKFGVKSQDVENAVKGVIKFASNNPYLQNQLFNEEIPLFLQVNSFKIPKTQGPVKQVYRVPMPHSILPSDADICLIVADVKGIKNNEHEKHLEHYETLLRSKDVTGIKKIMTFHEFRTEYETYELKNRLVDLYDVFLVDAKISGKVVNKCGSIFYKKRKVPTAVKLYLPKLKSHMDKALKKAFFHLNVKSDSHIVQIGHSKNNTNDLVENVFSVVEFLEKQFPGKMNNIRSLNVYTYRGSSIPAYISLKNPNEVKVPTISNKKPKAYKSFSGELTTQYNANILIRPSGQVVVRRKKTHDKPNEDNQDDNITDAEILRENKILDQAEKQNVDSSNKTKNTGKKRKLSESVKTQQKNPSPSGTKKLKREKQQANKLVGEGKAHSAEQIKGRKGKKSSNKVGENTNSSKKSNIDENIQRDAKKTKTVVTKTTKVEKGVKQKVVKNKFKKKYVK